MTTISLGAKKFGTDLGMKAPAKRSTKHANQQLKTSSDS